MTKNNNWNEFKYKLENKFVTPAVIEDSVTKLIKELVVFEKDQKLLIQLKTLFSDKSIRSISYLQVLSISEINLLTDIFTEFWSLKGDVYTEINEDILELIYNYKVLDKEENIEKKIISPDSRKLINILLDKEKKD